MEIAKEIIGYRNILLKGVALILLTCFLVRFWHVFGIIENVCKKWLQERQGGGR